MDDRPSLVIQMDGIGKEFTNSHPVLNRLDFNVASGESVALIGRSGSGKSTLLSIAGLLDRPSVGTYKFLGADVTKASELRAASIRRSKIGFVFQRFGLITHLTVQENVILPLRHSARLSSRAMRSAADEMLHAVNLDGYGRRHPAELSGGEQQRVAIARALIARPQLILADEPTGSLDTDTGAKIISLLKSIVLDHGAALVVVTHDPTIARALSRSVILQAGTILESPPSRLGRHS